MAIFNCVIQINLIDFEIGKIVFIIKALNLVLGFPNDQYPPTTKNYLPCLVIGGAVSIRRKGLIAIAAVLQDFGVLLFVSKR